MRRRRRLRRVGPARRSAPKSPTAKSVTQPALSRPVHADIATISLFARSLLRHARPSPLRRAQPAALLRAPVRLSSSLSALPPHELKQHLAERITQHYQAQGDSPQESADLARQELGWLEEAALARSAGGGKAADGGHREVLERMVKELVEEHKPLAYIIGTNRLPFFVVWMNR